MLVIKRSASKNNQYLSYHMESTFLTYEMYFGLFPKSPVTAPPRHGLEKESDCNSQPPRVTGFKVINFIINIYISKSRARFTRRVLLKSNCQFGEDYNIFSKFPLVCVVLGFWEKIPKMPPEGSVNGDFGNRLMQCYSELSITKMQSTSTF